MTGKWIIKPTFMENSYLTIYIKFLFFICWVLQEGHVAMRWGHRIDGDCNEGSVTVGSEDSESGQWKDSIRCDWINTLKNPRAAIRKLEKYGHRSTSRSICIQRLRFSVPHDSPNLGRWDPEQTLGQREWGYTKLINENKNRNKKRGKG